MDWLFQNRCLPIGLDLGASRIKMLQLGQHGSELRVIASGSYSLPRELPADEAERVALLQEGCEKLLATFPFRGRRVVSSLPVMAIDYKNIRMPRMPESERSAAVEWEAMDRINGEAGEYKVAHLHAGEVRQGDEHRDEIIMMTVRDSVLREHLSVLEGCDLRPVAIDVTPTALARCFSRFVRRESDASLVRVFVDVGRSCSKVLILHGSRTVFFKLIDLGGRHLDEAVANHLSLPLEDAAELRQRLMHDQEQSSEGGEDKALFGSTRRDSTRRAVYESTRIVVGELAKELGLCLRYYSVTFRGARPSVVHLTGGEAQDLMLVKVLGEQLDMDVQLGEPLAGIDLSGTQISLERRGGLTEWSVACGLSLRGGMAERRERGAA